jgi:phosphoglycerate kinase
MALTMKRAPLAASRVAGRRMAVAARPIVSSPIMGGARFAEVSIDLSAARVSRNNRTRVVVEAVKKSVGDLKKADLDGAIVRLHFQQRWERCA